MSLPQENSAPAPVGSPFAPANGLTSRREMFCRHYVACGNAAEAARQAGYAEDNARQQGYRLLDDDAIRARIEELWHHAEAARTGDRDLLIDKTERLFEAAMAAKCFNAAARALALQIRLAGFMGPARDREEVQPGRAGPVARAESRKAEAAETPPAEAPPAEAPPAEIGAAPDAPDTLDAPSGEHARTATAPALPSAAPLPEARPDPWAEAARIERERRLARVRAKLARLHRERGSANRAVPAARTTQAAA